MFLRSLIAVFTLCLLPLHALAQQEPVFKDYTEMRAELDDMMMSRQIKKLMLRFGGSKSMSEEELDDMETRMRGLFPYDFKHVAVIKRDEMENGFAHELIAYWTGLRYVYVLVLIHQRDNELVTINTRFNTDIYKMIGEF